MSRLQKIGCGACAITPTIFSALVEPLDRRRFDAIVARRNGDAYDKSFFSWNHLLALIYAQFSDLDSLRALEAGWNANCQHHYHLGCGPLASSTLADANQRRPVEVFLDAFDLVAGQLDRQCRNDGRAFLRLIDSTPIPLGKICRWAKSNGRIRGMKVHVVYDPHHDLPRVLDITDANVNDAQVGRTIEIDPRPQPTSSTKATCIIVVDRHPPGRLLFVTRPKENMGLRVLATRPLAETQGDGFVVLADEDVVLSSKGDSKLPIPLRRIRIRRDNEKALSLLTNDRKRSAVEIAALYKGRWQIELLFRWMKQHLKIRKFLGANDNAIKLQIYAAMIAYALLRLAAKTKKVPHSILRFTDLVRKFLFERRRSPQSRSRPP